MYQLLSQYTETMRGTTEDGPHARELRHDTRARRWLDRSGGMSAVISEAAWQLLVDRLRVRRRIGAVALSILMAAVAGTFVLTTAVDLSEYAAFVIVLVVLAGCLAAMTVAELRRDRERIAGSGVRMSRSNRLQLHDVLGPPRLLLLGGTLAVDETSLALDERLRTADAARTLVIANLASIEAVEFVTGPGRGWLNGLGFVVVAAAIGLGLLAGMPRRWPERGRGLRPGYQR